MKPDPFTFDRRLYDLLQQDGFERFTTREMRDAYAKHLAGVTYRLGDVRICSGLMIPDTHLGENRRH